MGTRDLEFSFPLVYIHGGRGRAGREPPQFSKTDLAIRRDANGAAIFKLHFGEAVLPGANLVALRQWSIESGILIAKGICACELHVAFNVAQADNPDVRRDFIVCAA